MKKKTACLIITVTLLTTLFAGLSFAEENNKGQIEEYDMVHYGTQESTPPYYRVFRDYSISGHYDYYGARPSYGEKHLTRRVSAAQLDEATRFEPGSLVTGVRDNYVGYQRGSTTAYYFGDDKYVWFIQNEGNPEQTAVSNQSIDDSSEYHSSLDFKSIGEFETTDYSLNWEEINKDIEEAFEDSAHYVNIEEVDANIWLPDTLIPQTLEVEDLEAKAIACYSTADGNFVVYMTYNKFLNGFNIGAYQQYLEGADIPTHQVTVNGIPCLLYFNQDLDVLSAQYLTAQGYVFQISFSSVKDDAYSTLAMIILSSLQPNNMENEMQSVVSENPVGDLIRR